MKVLHNSQGQFNAIQDLIFDLKEIKVSADFIVVVIMTITEDLDMILSLAHILLFLSNHFL